MENESPREIKRRVRKLMRKADGATMEKTIEYIKECAVILGIIKQLRKVKNEN